MAQWPLLKRKAWLDDNVESRTGVQLIESIDPRGEALFAVAVDQDFEGIVAKHHAAPYRAGRRRPG